MPNRPATPKVDASIAGVPNDSPRPVASREWSKVYFDAAFEDFEFDRLIESIGIAELTGSVRRRRRCLRLQRVVNGICNRRSSLSSGL
jgi:hypothetical protein